MYLSSTFFYYLLCVCVQVLAVTVQGVPEGVHPPLVTALSPSSLHVSWSEPSRPGGIIQRYHLNQTGVGTIFTHKNGPRNYTVTGKILRLLNVSVFLYFFTSPFLTILSFYFHSLLCIPFFLHFLTPSLTLQIFFPQPLSFVFLLLLHSSLLLSLTCPPFFSFPVSSLFYVCWFPEDLTEFTSDSCHALVQPLTETQTHTQTQKKQKHSR